MKSLLLTIAMLTRKLLCPTFALTLLISTVVIGSVRADAARLRVGPEVAISPFMSGAAAFDQTQVHIASNGSGFVAVWLDAREQLTAPQLYAAQLNDRGEPGNPAGGAIAQSVQAADIVSDGQNYMVAYVSNDAVFVQRLDSEARLLGGARRLENGSVAGIASNGDTYIVALSDSAVTTKFVVLDRGLGTLGTFTARIRPAVGGLSARGGQYLVAGTDTSFCSQNTSCNGHVMLLSLNETGVVSSRTFAKVIPSGRRVVTAFAGDRFLLASNAYQVFRDDGTASNELPIQFDAGDSIVTAAWDGTDFLVAAAGVRDGRIRAIRVNAEGSASGAAPFLLTTGPADSIGFQSSTGGTVAIWSEKTDVSFDVFSRAGSFKDLATSNGDPTLVSRVNGQAQRDPDLVASPSIFAVWNEIGARATIAGAIAGRAIDVADDANISSAPAIARGDTTYLVVWSDRSNTVLARRFALDGDALDTLPITIATRSQENGHDVSVAFSGGVYLIAWNEHSLLGRRLGEFGVLLDAPFTIVNSPPYELVERPTVVATEDRFSLTASGLTFSLSDYGPELPLTRIWSTHVSRDGVPEAVSVPIGERDYRDPHFDLTSLRHTIADDVTTTVWIDYSNIGQPYQQWTATPCISAVQAADATPRTLRCFSPAKVPNIPIQGESVDIAWNGLEHVLVWTEDTKAFAMRLDRYLQPLDDEPIAIAENVLPGSRIRATPTSGGVTIAYARIDRAAGDVPRVFLRTIARSDAPLSPHRRSARP